MSENTVGKFDFGQMPVSPQVKDLVGWNVAVFGTGAQIESDTYFDPQTGEAAIGYVAHMVAVNPDTGEVRISDPMMPGVLWQVILKKAVERSIRKTQWIPFKVVEATGTGKKSGQTMYVPAPVSDRETELDTLWEAVRKYMTEEVGLSDDDELTELQSVDIHELGSTEVKQLASE